MTTPHKLVLTVRLTYPDRMKMFAIHRAGCPDIDKEVRNKSASAYPLSVRPDTEQELVDLVGETMYGRAYRAERIALDLGDIRVLPCAGYQAQRGS